METKSFYEKSSYNFRCTFVNANKKETSNGLVKECEIEIEEEEETDEEVKVANCS